MLAAYRLAIVVEGAYARARLGQVPMAVGEALHKDAQLLMTQAKNLTIAGARMRDFDMCSE
ncbi:hypothetical protein [Nocardia salmonicida]|uniref:hypothetical protein n=1 Tax=Nocardia salmonicida TaxID=53431 RepID=UPI00340EBFC3